MKTRFLKIFSVLLLLTATACPRAAAYSTPPNWLPMSMPNVTYDPVNNKLNTLLIVSDPARISLRTNTNATGGIAPGIASFDPASPVSVLNGTAFSRNIGWNDPYAADTNGKAILDQVRSVYGPDAYIWIDCLSKSAGLNTYQAIGHYGIDPDTTFPIYPGIYPGIFGTAGSSTKWLWDGVMDHNTYSVSFSYITTSNQPFSANYRLYIGDAAGNELLVDKNGTPVASAAIDTTWNWPGPQFVFTSQAGVEINTLVESAPLRLTGMSAGPQDISISGGEYAISTTSAATTPAAGEWNAWTSLPGKVSTDYWVKVRQNSGPAVGITTVATLAIPAAWGPGTFSVTTIAADTTPDPFTFTPLTGAALNTITESAPLTLTGINTPAAISVSAGALYATSVDNGANWGPWSTGSGTVSLNDQVKLQIVSATTPATETLATLTVGGVSGNFSVTTLAPNPAWPVKIKYGTELPSLTYAYSIAPFDAVIMIKDGFLTTESSFSANRNITVTLQGGYDPTFMTTSGVTIIQGVQNVFTVKQGKVIVDKVYLRSTGPL